MPSHCVTEDISQCWANQPAANGGYAGVCKNSGQSHIRFFGDREGTGSSFLSKLTWESYTASERTRVWLNCVWFCGELPTVRSFSMDSVSKEGQPSSSSKKTQCNAQCNNTQSAVHPKFWPYPEPRDRFCLEEWLDNDRVGLIRTFQGPAPVRVVSQGQWPS